MSHYNSETSTVNLSRSIPGDYNGLSRSSIPVLLGRKNSARATPHIKDLRPEVVSVAPCSSTRYVLDFTIWNCHSLGTLGALLVRIVVFGPSSSLHPIQTSSGFCRRASTLIIAHVQPSFQCKVEPPMGIVLPHPVSLT